MISIQVFENPSTRIQASTVTVLRAGPSPGITIFSWSGRCSATS